MLTSVHKESEEKVEKRVARCPSPNHRRLQVIHSREHPAFFDKSEFRYATAHAQCKPGAICDQTTMLLPLHWSCEEVNQEYGRLSKAITAAQVILKVVYLFFVCV